MNILCHFIESFSTAEYKFMVNHEELIGTTVYLTL